jgi:hypothetical protein
MDPLPARAAFLGTISTVDSRLGLLPAEAFPAADCVVVFPLGIIMASASHLLSCRAARPEAADA